MSADPDEMLQLYHRVTIFFFFLQHIVFDMHSRSENLSAERKKKGSNSRPRENNNIAPWQERQASSKSNHKTERTLNYYYPVLENLWLESSVLGSYT